MTLIVGIGNPGAEYEKTRHNVGFQAVDEFARKNGLAIDKNKHHGLFGSGRLGSGNVYLLKPMEYMNLSGRAVGSVVGYYRLRPEQVLVFHDDLDLELGRIKVVASQGAGGHKGISSIISHLGGATDFARVKIGIGRPGRPMPVESYVLSRFTPEEEQLIGDAVELAVNAAQVYLERGLAASQTQFNHKATRQL